MAKPEAGIPTSSGMLPLAKDFSGLRGHEFLISVFVPEPNMDAISRTLRSLLVHCLLKAARHYDSASKLIEAQIEEGLRTPKEMMRGRELPILDFALEFEDCINAINRAQLAGSALCKHNPASPFSRFLGEQAARLTAINDIRRATEHMEERIVHNQLEGGPFVVRPSSDGNHVILGKHYLAFADLKVVIDALFDRVAELLPTFKANLASTLPKTPMRLSASATITVKNPDTSD